MKLIATVSLTLCLGLAPGLALAQKAQHAHQHGIAELDVAVDASEVTLQLEMPLDSLVGFERAPRNDAERQAAAAALAKARDGASLFRFDTASGCTLKQAEVDADVLEPGAKAGASQGGDGHADLDATYVFTCAMPSKLGLLDVRLFDVFKRLERVHVQAALPSGQRKATLRRGTTRVALTK